MKHTPGPWQWDGNDLDGPNYQEVISSRVACGAFCQGGSVQLDVSEANARLIAAAPELLEALVGLCGSHGSTAPVPVESYNKAYEALRKAGYYE